MKLENDFQKDLVKNKWGLNNSFAHYMYKIAFTRIAYLLSSHIDIRYIRLEKVVANYSVINLMVKSNERKKNFAAQFEGLKHCCCH